MVGFDDDPFMLIPERIYNSPVQSTNPAVDVLSHLLSGFNIRAIHCLSATGKLQYNGTSLFHNCHSLNLRIRNIDLADSTD